MHLCMIWCRQRVWRKLKCERLHGILHKIFFFHPWCCSEEKKEIIILKSMKTWCHSYKRGNWKKPSAFLSNWKFNSYFSSEVTCLNIWRHFCKQKRQFHEKIHWILQLMYILRESIEVSAIFACHFHIFESSKIIVVNFSIDKMFTDIVKVESLSCFITNIDWFHVNSELQKNQVTLLQFSHLKNILWNQCTLTFIAWFHGILVARPKSSNSQTLFNFSVLPFSSSWILSKSAAWTFYDAWTIVEKMDRFPDNLLNVSTQDKKSLVLLQRSSTLFRQTGQNSSISQFVFVCDRGRKTSGF